MSRAISPKIGNLLNVLKQTASGWSQDNAMRLAAAMACYVILALAPMLVIFVKFLGWFFQDRTDAVVKSQLDHLVGPAGGEAIGAMIENAHQSGGGTLATVFSFLLVAISASGVFVSLQDALNTIWEVKVKPNAGWGHWFRKRFLSIGMVFGIAILLMSSMAITALLSQIIDGIFGADRSGFVANAGAYVLDFVMTVAVAWVLFMGVFKFLPDVKIAWNDVWLGALVTAVLFKVGQIGLAVYFHYGSSTSAYGAFGSLVAVLLWAYYSSAILFFGAEFTQVWAKAHGREIEPEEHAERVTREDRAEQGIPGRKITPAPVHLPVSPPTPRGLPDDQPSTAYVSGVGAAALGAMVAGVATWYFASRPARRQAVAVRMNERINAVESKLGRVSQIKHYLEQMDVSDRIDRVSQEIHRAGRHVRANETGRPMWLVRLGDFVGGRWSNL